MEYSDLKLNIRIFPCLDCEHGRVVKGLNFVGLCNAGEPSERTSLHDDIRAVSIPVIASGGVSSMDDLRALKECGAKLDGVISGRALYDGRIDAAEAVSLLAGDT